MVRKPPLADIDPHLAQWIMFLLSLLFFAIAILGAVGEYLGWWGLVGDIAITVGSIAGLLLGVATHITSATETQLGTVHDAVRDNGEKLDTLVDIDEDLDRVQLELDTQTGVLDRQVGLLTEIRDRL